MINTLHDKIIGIANEKYWTITSRACSSNISNSDLKQLCDYAKIESEIYSIFKLGPIVVRRGRVLTTIFGFVAYCLYILVMVKSKT